MAEFKARIVGISYHLPAKIEANEDLARENPDWDMDDLYQKTGIRCRHIAAEGETAADLGFQAATSLLERGIIDPREIDVLIFCTQAPDHFLPPSACILQHRLGLGKHVAAFDMNLGCSGFIYGLRLADSLIQSGVARHVLLITADTYSKVIHPRDRAVRTLFGDGAAATLVSRASSGPGEIGEFVLGTNGDGAEKLIVPSGGFRLPRSPETAVEDTDNTGCVRSRDHLYMDGKAVFGFALSVVPRLVIELLEKASLTLEQIDWYVYHQANKYMLDNLMARSKVPQEKQVWFMNDVGNTVSASIPIALQGYVECGRICSGHRLMLIGFGVGYSWGACIIDWG